MPLLALLGGGFIITIFVGSILGIVAHGQIRSLRRALDELRHQLAKLQHRLDQLSQERKSEPSSQPHPPVESTPPASVFSQAKQAAATIVNQSRPQEPPAPPGPAQGTAPSPPVVPPADLPISREPEPIPAPAPTTPSSPALAPPSSLATPPPAPAPQPAPSAAPSDPPPPSAPMPARPVASDLEAAWSRFEALVAGRWMTWIGALIVFIAGAFFVHYSFTHGLIGPWGRLIIGLLTASGIAVAGDVLVRKGWRAFGQGILGLGLMLGYAVLFAGYAYPDTRVLGQIGAFAAMTVVTALGLWRSLRHDAMAVAILATLGGLLTPILASSGNGSRDGLLGYLLLLDLGVLGAALFRRWRTLDAIACAGTTALIGLWWEHAGRPPQGVGMWAWLLAFWSLFTGVAVAYRIRWRALLPAESYAVACASATAALVGLAVMVESDGLVAGGSAAMAAIYLALALRAERLFGGDTFARAGLTALSVFCFTVALPPLLHRPSTLGTAWAIEAALLWWLCRRSEAAHLGMLGTLVLGAAGWKAGQELFDVQAALIPLANLPYGFALAFPAAMAACAWLARGIVHPQLSTLTMWLACLTPIWLAMRTCAEWAAADMGWKLASVQSGTLTVIVIAVTWIARGSVQNALLITAQVMYFIGLLRWFPNLVHHELGHSLLRHPALWSGLLVAAGSASLAFRLPGVARAGYAVLTGWWLGLVAHYCLGLAIDGGTSLHAMRAVSWTLISIALGICLRRLDATRLPAIPPLLMAMGCVIAGYVTQSGHAAPVANPLAMASFVISAGIVVITMVRSSQQERIGGLLFAGIWTLLSMAIDLHQTSGSSPDTKRLGFTHPHALLGLVWAASGLLTSWFFDRGSMRGRFIPPIFAGMSAGTALLLYSCPLPVILPVLNPPWIIGLAALVVIWRSCQASESGHRVIWALCGTGWAWLLMTIEAIATARSLELGRSGMLLGITIAWSLVGAGALLTGLVAGMRPLRLTGMAMLGLTVAKLTVIDLSSLHELARIASFACAGLVLLFGSWGYHRLERRLKK